MSRRPETNELEKKVETSLTAVSEMIFGSDSKHKRKAKSKSWNYSKCQQNKTESNEMK